MVNKHIKKKTRMKSVVSVSIAHSNGKHHYSDDWVNWQTIVSIAHSNGKPEKPGELRIKGPKKLLSLNRS